MLSTIRMRLTAAKDLLRADHVQGTKPLRSSHVSEQVKHGLQPSGHLVNPKKIKGAHLPAYCARTVCMRREPRQVSLNKRSIVRTVFPGRHNRTASTGHGKEVYARTRGTTDSPRKSRHASSCSIIAGKPCRSKKRTQSTGGTLMDEIAFWSEIRSYSLRLFRFLP